MKKFITIIFITISTSCNTDKTFDKSKWMEQGDLKMYPYRKSMLKDLTDNHKITGLSYGQLINLIGEPDKTSINNNSIIYYDIITDYGHDIDPIFTKTLKISLTKDSTVKNFKIEEWKNNL